jgi:uncharacterized protein (DUF362 family)
MRTDRRNFLKGMTCLAGASFLGGCKSNSTNAMTQGGSPRKLRKNTLKEGLFVAEGNDPALMVRAALKEIGGLTSLIKEGDTVVIKPNIGWDRSPEYAANTNPDVIKELISQCFKSGAKTVKIFDRTCNDARKCYKNSGIGAVAEELGAKVSYVDEADSFYENVTAGDAVTLKTWPVYKDIIKADVIINVPVLKHHSLAGITISMKNLMGIIGGDRGDIHSNIHNKLSDLTRIIPVELVVVDAYRILTAHGPSGGNLKDVRMGNQIIVGTNPVMADAWASRLFGIKPEENKFLKIAYSQGLGEINPDKMKVKKIKV